MKSLPKTVTYGIVNRYAKLEDGYLFTLKNGEWYAWEALSKSKEKYPNVILKGVAHKLHRLKHCLDIKADVLGSDTVHHRDNVQSNNSCSNLTITDHRTNTALDAVSCLPKVNRVGKYPFVKQMRKASVLRGVRGTKVTVFNYSCATEEEYWRTLDIYNKYFGVCGKYYQNVLAAVESDNVDRVAIRKFMFSKM